MKPIRLSAAAILFTGLAIVAQAQIKGPVTAICKDATSWSGKTRAGACSHHGGVKSYADDAVLVKVWVNTKSKIYHCPADPAYGKTKAGNYMTETAAKAAGDKPDSGKTCS